ncbi:inositol monophosphatase family protein [Candidatus Bandiella euplotis]|uniref:Inositol-1-monophosphatase n=1 Tax=Candidatus Bandiella euplotis TaxID=1664265 RepID=A0ABZ0UNJ1_9RICK|nr:inositol monophosphatase [Candidatus Bandiella woodruffii]WPX96539.1 Inositol-1-monophosphatase [Candidatus Bandiella woodruffii]
MKNFNADLNVVLDAIRKALPRISRDFYEVEKLQISKKGVTDFVTNTDLKTEKTLVTHLQKARADYGFLTEESGELPSLNGTKNLGFEYRWVIDPIDGTFNFMHGIPFFCISVALVKIENNKTSVLLGVICNPSNNEIFYAGRNMGAHLIDHLGTHRKMRIPHHKDFERVVCAVHDNPHPTGRLNEYIDYVQKKHCRTRIFGASALEMAYLADGRINLLIQGKLNVWDYAAGLLIIREAGGVVRDLNGKDFEFNVDSGIMAGNQDMIEEIEKGYKNV